MISKRLREKLKNISNEYNQVSKDLQDTANLSNPKIIKELNIKLSQIEDTNNYYLNYCSLENELSSLLDNISNEKDPEFSELMKEELSNLKKQISELEKKITLSLIPTDPNDSKNVIIEIRGAAGGDEANIFAGDLFRMYTRFAELKNWKYEVLELNHSETGGFSQISFLIKGKNVYKELKYESGIHRVQRVPATESKGRVHTSTSSVAVLPEASQIDIIIKPSDLRIDTYRASGAGGQHVNMTDSAVRITHIPTGVVVTSQDGRSQHDNKDKCMKVLYSKIYEKQLEEENKKIHDIRTLAVGHGQRSEKIRTYNYPQNRVTDHRIQFSTNSLEQIMQGKLDLLVEKLIIFDTNEKLEKIN